MEALDSSNGSEQHRCSADEERYRFLLENTGDILWTMDLSGHWQFMTKNVERVLHISLQDILGKKAWDFLAPEYVGVMKEKLKRRLRGEEIGPYDVVVINGYGERVPFEVMASPIRNEKGKIVGVQGISRDISGRKCAEEAARKSEAKFKDLVENTYDWVWEADRNLVFTYTNPRVRDYLGYTPEEVTGRPLYDFMEPEMAKRIAARLDNMVKQHRQYDVAEKTLISKGGEPVYFEMTVSVIYASDGTVEGYRGICRDIRDRKRAEEALRKAYGELEKRVEERTRELSRAKAQAELYLDLMSHDINNMNMVAMGKIEMLKSAIAGDRNAVGLLNGALDMLSSSSRLIDIVSKIQKAEQKGLETKMVNLCDVLEDVKKKYSAMPGKEVRICISYLDTNSCMVRANRLIEDIFSNLVENSIKHSVPGKPVVINIKLTKICEGGRGYYQITTEDYGPGIPDELKSKLFTRLERGKTRAPGRGLGLYLVRTLVENFEGKVWVEDRIRGNYHKGSKFIVILPAAPA
jgi:PAS domain S-box-containing protein